ncbi:MAG: Mn2+/Fe2+ NRAMP family transporter [Cognaticolwellia sp.]|jgi:Mn2+/Fe2+ NRAMP family transporter
METVKTTQYKKGKWSQFLKMLGPGLLFAGSAVGVSHLIQATQAGANYGYGLLWLVILIHFVKYPFFEFGPRYAASTGEDLITGYKKIGRWVLILFSIVTVLTMFIIQAVVTVVTASLAVNIFGVFESPIIWAGILLVICTVILIIGKYKLLDNLIKIVIIVLTVSTLLAVILAYTNNNISAPPITFELPIQGAGLVFLIALMGWMPAPLDLSVWHSIWTTEKQKATNEDFNLNYSLKDFRIGYFGTIVLAVFFLSLGALIMFNSGEEFSPSGAKFAAQLINMYVTALGDWAKWLIAIAAFTTMFSTTLTCLDALPRVMSRATTLLQDKEEEPKSYYWIWIILLIIGAMIILIFFMQSMKQLVLVATILSFLTTPFFAIANYALITGKNVPDYAKPNRALRIWALLGIVFLIGFSLLYVFTMLL